MKRGVIGSVSVPLLVVVLSILSLWEPANAFATAQNAASHLLDVKPFGGKQPVVMGNMPRSNLAYRGGPVVSATMKVYAIFWEPIGSFVSPRYNSLILRYFSDVGTSALYRNNTQYHDARGNTSSNAVLAASWVDTAAYPAKKLTDKQIQGEVAHAISVNRWSADLDTVFFVFTARGEIVCNNSNQCSFAAFCASHGVLGRSIIYATIPYAGTNLNACGVPNSPNGDIDAESAINVASHEQMEVATDPLVSAWIDPAGAEIGDKCAWNFGGVTTFNGHPYLVQKEWDNAVNGCVIAGP